MAPNRVWTMTSVSFRTTQRLYFAIKPDFRPGAGGLPVGLQLIGNYFDEGRLLHAAHALQQATDFHTRAPSGY